MFISPDSHLSLCEEVSLKLHRGAYVLLDDRYFPHPLWTEGSLSAESVGTEGRGEAEVVALWHGHSAFRGLHLISLHSYTWVLWSPRGGIGVNQSSQVHSKAVVFVFRAKSQRVTCVMKHKWAKEIKVISLIFSLALEDRSSKQIACRKKEKGFIYFEVWSESCSLTSVRCSHTWLENPSYKLPNGNKNISQLW